jgi:hypothetical protein
MPEMIQTHRYLLLMLRRELTPTIIDDEPFLNLCVQQFIIPMIYVYILVILYICIQCGTMNHVSNKQQHNFQRIFSLRNWSIKMRYKYQYMYENDTITRSSLNGSIFNWSLKDYKTAAD